MFFVPYKSRYRAKIQIMGISKTSDNIQIKMKLPNPSQEPPASSESPNHDLGDIGVLCTFKMKIYGQNQNMGVSKTSANIQIKIQMPNPNQEPPESSKGPNQDLKELDVLCTFKIKIDSQNLEHGCTKGQ